MTGMMKKLLLSMSFVLVALAAPAALLIRDIIMKVK